LLKIYGRISISQIDKITDQKARLIDQHSDFDPEFQKSVLSILKKLYVRGETVGANYAYLYDRVASSFADPSKRVLQRYGTQGECIGPGQWEPLPTEQPSKMDARRREVGLNSMKEYQKMFKYICR
jgi:hypothetical protein